MKILTKIMILVVFVITVSCKSDNITEPGTDYSNADLATQLAHYKYSDQQYYLQFFPNDTFLQKQFTYSEKYGQFVLLYERSGKYKLEGNLIKLSEVKVNYNTSLGAVSIIWADQEVSLVNGKIAFKGVIILEATGNKNELWNNWKTIKLVFHYVDATNTIYDGRQEYFYEFISTDQKVRWGYDYLDGHPWPPSEYKSDFTYAPPDLYIKGAAENYQVVFKNNKMYWYYLPRLNKNSLTGFLVQPLYPESITYN